MTTLGTTPAGTTKVARFPVALTSEAETLPTVIVILVAPKPLPVRVTLCPTAAHEGVIDLIWAAAAHAAEGDAGRSGRQRLSDTATQRLTIRE
jgi:hypothetical protein